MVSRAREFWLLSLAFAIIVVGFGAVMLACYPERGWGELRYAALIAVAGYAAHFVLRAKGSRSDQLILPLAILLTGVGMVFVYRLAPPVIFVRQMLNLVFAFVCLLLVIGFLREPGVLGRFRYTAMIIGLFLMLVTAFLGQEVGGARLSLRIAGIGFQPSELLKLIMVVFLASYLSEKRQLMQFAAGRWGLLSTLDLRLLGPLVAVWALSLLLVILQRDLGAALLFLGILLAMVYLASGRPVYVGLGSVLFVLGCWGSYLSVARVRERVQVWLDPWSQISRNGYQIAQSLFALGYGGVIGAGLGSGFASRRSVLPAVHTDFIFAAIGEELGFAGAVAVICLYLLLILRAFRVGLNARDEFSGLLAAGLGIVLALQTFVIIAGVARLIPLTGITLPFVSYGGSSLVCNYLLVGLLLAVSHQTARAKE